MGKKINEIVINSFRGYENETKFDFTKNSIPVDLVVLHAPNGFGKTSFFESVEWCLSGKLSRIENNRILKDAEDKDRGFTLSNKNSNRLGVVTIIDNESKKLTRQVKQSRFSPKGMRDYGYDEIINNGLLSLTTIDTTSHILTQDGMDTFLRFKNGEDKFNALTSYWDQGEITSDKYRYLNLLSNKIKNKIKNLNAQISVIEQEIQSIQITQEQIDDINKKLIEINRKLPKNKEIIFTFKKNTKSKEIVNTISKLTILKIEKENDIDELKLKNQRLITLKQNQLNYINNKSNAMQLKQDMKSTKKLLDKFKELKALKKTLKELNEETEKNSILQSKLKKIDKLYPEFLKIQTELDVIQKSLINVNIKIQKLVENRQNKDNELIRLHTRIEESKKTKSAIEEIDKFINLNLITLESLNTKLMNTKLLLNDETKRFKQISKDYSNYENKVKKLDYDKLFENSFNKQRFNISEKYLTEYLKIKELFHKNNKLKKTLKESVDKKERALEFKNDITKLISLGQNLIQKTNSSTCPLCHQNYYQHAKLLQKINTDNIDILEIEKLQSEIDLIENESLQLNTNYELKIENLKQLIENDYLKLTEKYTSLQRQYKNAKHIIDKYELEILRIETEFTQLSNELQNIHQLDIKDTSFLNIHKAYKNILNSYYLNEKNKIKTNLTIFQKKLDTLEEEKNNIILEIMQEKQLKENLQNNRTTLESNPTFIEYRLLNQTLNILPEHSQDNIQSKIKQNTKLLSEVNKSVSDINKKITPIQQELSKIKINSLELKLNFEKKEKDLLEITSQIEKFEKEVQFFKLTINNLNEKTFDDTLKKIQIKKNKIQESKDNITVLIEIIQSFITDININTKKQDITNLKTELTLESDFLNKVQITIEKYKNFIEKTISECFNITTINEIYNRIDPHPIKKIIQFIPELDNGTKLRVKTSENEISNENDDPILYNSSGQISILSLSIFLAKALQTQDELDTIFMDDPIQYLDSINVLSFIDLIRTIITKQQRQIIISTHDKSFYQLLQKKLDSQYFNSKFIELESYGKIKEE